jgi:hypothetical protein
MRSTIIAAKSSTPKIIPAIAERRVRQKLAVDEARRRSSQAAPEPC